jgi:hypothetical protein
MAITRAQQFKQMLAQGGRIGLQGGGADMGRERGPETGRPGRDDKDFGGRDERPVMGPGSTNPRRVGPLPSITITPEPKPDIALGFRNPMAQFSPAAARIARQMRNEKIGLGDRLGIPGLFPLTKSLANRIEVSKPTFVDQMRTDFRQALSPRVDRIDDDRDNTLPRWAQLGFNSEAEYLASLAAYNQVDEEELKEEKEPFKIAPRFAAEGGRIGAQEGGIMPRLNQLGSGVSSAEQTLQDINQRLESAESSLGSGSGELPTGLTTSVQTPDPFFGKKPLGADKPLGGMFDGKQFDSVKSAYDYAVKSAQETRAGGMLGRVVLPGEMGFEGFSGLFNRLNDPNAQQPMAALGGQGVLGIPAASYADGGNVVGGEFDFESARQMYGLGKLVKKVTRSVKKIAKSPVGKAAIAAALFRMGGGLSETGFLKSRALPFLVGTSRQVGPQVQTTKGIIGVGGKFDPFKTILATSGIAGLMAGQEEEDETVSPEQLGPSLNIPEYRRDPFGNLAIRYRAEGGSTEQKEPVAKKTMPLLDMGGMEKDYREDGGFVPIGRMEKADDVPARLSKNEFVFTADAVRNAGDGDVDKGAEVMYNMMKNLEAGGEVSEESQGLEGARRMFQTSQRLEEVL